MTRPPGSRVLVVADDLSGAADCAVTWANWGFQAVVTFDVSASDSVGSPPVLAVDTDSRRMSPEHAAATTRTAITHHAGPDCRVLYKKIDSTLRGNIGAEVAAASGAERLAIVAPAFPAAGRTTERGRVLVAGTPLQETDLWRREGGGRDPDLVAMLTVAGLPATVADLDVVRSGHLTAWLHQQLAAGMRAVVCDAVTETDLEAIASVSPPCSVLWVGSAGLARHLRAATGPAADNALPIPRRHANRPSLVVVGSLSNVSRAQLGRLAAAPGIAALSAGEEELRSAGGALTDQLAAALGDASLAAVVVATEAGANADPAKGGAELAVALGRQVAPLLPRAGGLVATGGETARALLAAAGVTALQLAGEVEPGVPLGLALGPEATRGLPVITKAGAFGTEATLLHCVEALHALPDAAEDVGCSTTHVR